MANGIKMMFEGKNWRCLFKILVIKGAQHSFSSLQIKYYVHQATAVACICFFRENTLPIKGISESIQTRRAAKYMLCALISHIYMVNHDSKHALTVDVTNSSFVAGLGDLFPMHVVYHMSLTDMLYACNRGASTTLQPHFQIKVYHLHYISSGL